VGADMLKERLQKTAWIPIFLISMVLLLAFSTIKNTQPLVDEISYFRVIGRYLSGDLSLEPSISTLPGYHLFMAGVAYLTHLSSLAGLRFINLVISLFSILAFYALIRSVHGESRPLKLYQYIFFPLLFPFFFLIYTDVLSLLLVFIAFYLAGIRRYNPAALMGILCLLVRQNNIAWLGLLFVYAYLDLYGTDLRQAGKSLARLPAFYLGFVLFAVFLVWNGGIAIGDTEMHPAFTLHFGNIYFILFLFSLVFLPLSINNLPRVAHLLRSRLWLLGVILLAYGFYLLTFKNDHIYNQINTEYFLRNIVLVQATSSLAWKSLFFLPVVYGGLSLAVTPLHSPRHYLLYPFTLLYLLPSWLVEPRYTLLPFCLFILYKMEMPEWLEYLTLGLWMLASYVLLVYTSSMTYFL
jgi:alpha-1,2-glucosyltransferase